MAEEIEGITLLGSEMLTWSDFASSDGAERGRLPALLVAGASSAGRVLVAGPHSAQVVGAVAAHFDGCDVVVRSYDDAVTLRGQLPAEVGVLCGTTSRLPRPSDGYAAVVALAGLDRVLCSEDEPQWRHTLDGLTGLLGERGELFVRVDNQLGLDSLAGTRAGDPNAHWPAGIRDAEPAPPRAETLEQHLAGQAIPVSESWACHGPRSEPTLAAGRGILERYRHDPLLGSLILRAYAGAAGGSHDPGTLARESLTHGLGATLAPVAVLHAAKGSSEARSAAAFVVEADGTSYSLTREGEQWLRTLVGPSPQLAVSDGLTRDAARLAGPVPSGALVADLVRQCCAQHDLSAVGPVLRRTRDWLAAEGDQAPVDRVPTTLEMLVDPPALMDPSLRAGTPAPADVVFVRALLVFSADLLQRGLPHPWAAGSSPAEIATELAAAIGLVVDDELRNAAIALDATLRPDGEVIDFDAPGGGQAPSSNAELLDELAGLRSEVETLHAQRAWLLRNIHARQRALRASRGAAQAVRSSAEYRVGTRVLWLRTKLRREPDKPAGWRDRSGEEERGPIPLEVEQDLLPPGYETQDKWI